MAKVLSLLTPNFMISPPNLVDRQAVPQRRKAFRPSESWLGGPSFERSLLGTGGAKWAKTAIEESSSMDWTWDGDSCLNEPKVS